jgi:hypothetical protein
MTDASSRSIPDGDGAVSFELDPWGSRWATGSLARTPQLIVAAKRFTSNALPRASMK